MYKALGINIKNPIQDDSFKFSKKFKKTSNPKIKVELLNDKALIEQSISKEELDPNSPIALYYRR
ncbi:hypothetical protein [Campylobacter fetus]|uniref:hypothetical protein n=1 Tax=Campylobacter fetus TaxID=196 RepID=UPI00073ABD18|nr:hypothetical protein [Campylobacter fetus]ALV65020.1 hypothetical protein CFTSP3_1055 [Campylobacter fetus subsp. testudinum Sp3]OCR85821.1 hypothetical protein CFT12S05168_02350 [Campylobacter fetus subsp. testudinum]